MPIPGADLRWVPAPRIKHKKMNEVSNENDGGAQAMAELTVDEPAQLKAEIARLEAELDDLRLLYDAVMEHGEAVEDQLAQQNLLLEETQKRLEAELADAARYLMSMLPEKRQEFPRTDWLLVPSTELGGDSFGYRRIDEDHFAFYLIDVCGHGVGSALLSVAAINVLRSPGMTQADFRDPSQVLAALNDMFPMEQQGNKFFTIWYGVHNSRTGELRYATGGHPPAILLRRSADGIAEATQLITVGGMAIGAFPAVDFESATTTIEPGDRLLLISDGTFEVDKPDGDMLTVDELAAQAVKDDSPEGLLAWVRSFVDSDALPDDFSVLRVEF